MADEFWRRCSTCKGEIAFSSSYWVCSVSTCNRKQNALVREGWDPLRFTWHNLDQQPATVLTEVVETVAGR